MKIAKTEPSVAKLWICALIIVFSTEVDATEPPDLSDIPHLTVKYYDIRGTTAPELRAQMNELGPTDPNDYKRMDAVTLWNFQWRWPGHGSLQCNLAAASVDYQINMTLPRLIDQSHVSKSLNAKWNSYLAALTSHERGHADFVVKEAPDVLMAIKSASCLTADSAVRHVLDIITQHDRDYDAKTNHSATQGARFP